MMARLVRIAFIAAVAGITSGAYAQTAAPPVWENSTMTKFRITSGDPACYLEAIGFVIKRNSVSEFGGSSEILVEDGNQNFSSVYGSWSLSGSTLSISAPGYTVNANWAGTTMTAKVTHLGGTGAKTSNCSYRVSGVHPNG